RVVPAARGFVAGGPSCVRRFWARMPALLAAWQKVARVAAVEALLVRSGGLRLAMVRRLVRAGRRIAVRGWVRRREREGLGSERVRWRLIDPIGETRAERQRHAVVLLSAAVGWGRGRNRRAAGRRASCQRVARPMAEPRPAWR